MKDKTLAELRPHLLSRLGVGEQAGAHRWGRAMVLPALLGGSLVSGKQRLYQREGERGPRARGANTELAPARGLLCGLGLARGVMLINSFV